MEKNQEMLKHFFEHPNFSTRTLNLLINFCGVWRNCRKNFEDSNFFLSKLVEQLHQFDSISRKKIDFIKNENSILSIDDATNQGRGRNVRLKCDFHLSRYVKRENWRRMSKPQEKRTSIDHQRRNMFFLFLNNAHYSIRVTKLQFAL